MRIQYLPLLLFLWCTAYGYGQEPSSPQEFLAQARELAGAGEYTEARKVLQQHLDNNPEDRDFKTLYAKTYSWEGNYSEARKLLNTITSEHRKEHEAWMASIRNERFASNYQIALGLVNKALEYLPQDPDLIAQRDQVLQALRDHANPNAPVHRAENRGQEGVRLFLQSTAEAFSQTFDPMYTQQLGVEFAGKAGKIMPAVQYDQRFGQQGLQWQLESYPTLGNRWHGYAAYAYSSSAIFPRHRGGAELYYISPKGWETSLGARYYQFRDGNTTLYTSSLGKYKGNYYVSGRLYVTPQEGGIPALTGQLFARRYFTSANHFLGLRGGYGYSTELRQLQDGQELLSETLFFVSSQELAVDYQWTPGAKSIVKLSLRGLRQEFAFDPGNYFLSLNLGLEYRFLFR